MTTSKDPMPDLAPYHDAPHCPTCGPAGPMVPPGHSGAHPTTATNLVDIRCAACGAWERPDLTTLDGLRRLLHVWWSAGAWMQKQSEPPNTEKPR